MGLSIDPVVPEKVIDAVYDAALARSLWPEALSRIGDEFRGAPTQLSVFDLASGSIPLGIGVDFMDGVWEVASRFATPETNPMLAIAMRIPIHQSVDQGLELGVQHFKSLEIYADLYRPQGHMPLFGTVVVRSQSAFGGLALMRREHWPLASAEDLALGERISLHVGRAVALSGLFDTYEGGSDSFEAALHQTRTPILLLNAEGAVTWMNPLAEAILGARDGLAVHRQRLYATDLAADARLTRAVGDAAQGTESMVTMLRRRTSSPLILRLSPLWRTQTRANAQILAHISEPRSRVWFDPDEAADVFSLTLAEAKVACAICAGARSLADVGRSLQITVNTVKTLLQRVYDKTSVRSQSELTILLSSALQPSRGPEK